MNIIIQRIRTTQQVASGILKIDGERICHTAEATSTLLPAGTYRIALFRCRKHYRKMPLLLRANEDYPCTSPTPHQCKHCHTSSLNFALREGCPMLRWGNGAYNRTDGAILIGEYYLPGIVIHSRQIFDRLYERIEKSISRGNQVWLIIS